MTKPSSEQITHTLDNFTRTLDNKLNDFMTLTDFGAKGDNNVSSYSANNIAISAALQYISTTGYSVIVPPGIYYCDPFQINNTIYGAQGQFIGVDHKRCILKRRNAGTDAFITVGSQSNTIFQSGMNFSNIKFDGGIKTNGPTFLGYDIVRTKFSSCDFNGGSIACSLMGGISITFSNCIFQNAGTGIKINKFTSSAGGGWSNLIHIDGGEIVDNSTVGLWFDGGRMLTISNVDVEGNGTTIDTIGHGGIYVGSGVGDEVVTNDTTSIGLNIHDCWFESNKGFADIHVNRGITNITNSTFFSALSTHDIKIEGEIYHINNINCSFTKAKNLSEGVDIGYTNTILNSQIPSLDFNPDRTTVAGLGAIAMRRGSIPVVQGMIRPNIQVGFATTDATGNLIVSFERSFVGLTIPHITLTPLDGTVKRTICLKLTSVNNTSFSVESTYIDVASASAISVGPIGFYWQAMGDVDLP